MYLGHYRTRRWIVVASFVILGLTMAALVLMWLRSHSPFSFSRDELYWILD